jgi:hypothetical protein
MAMKKATAAKANGKALSELNNPFREFGGYWSSVEALRALGVEKMHGFDAIIPAVIRAMGAERFKAFKAKDARNEETGKDANARIIQNVSVVARKDYGFPLNAEGWEVRFDGREKVAGLFRCPKATEKPERQERKAKKPEPKAAAKPEAKKKAAPATSKAKKQSKAEKPKATTKAA